jgi:tetratricopeptide (TPR) repeat protein
MKAPFCLFCVIVLMQAMLNDRAVVASSGGTIEYPDCAGEIDKFPSTPPKKSAQFYYDCGTAMFAYATDGSRQYAMGESVRRESLAEFAIDYYNRAISINPKYAEAYYGRGIANDYVDKKSDAVIDMSKAIELFRQQGKIYLYAEAHFNRGDLHYRMGNKREAIADMSKASELFRQQGKMDLYQEALTKLKEFQSNRDNS